MKKIKYLIAGRLNLNLLLLVKVQIKFHKAIDIDERPPKGFVRCFGGEPRDRTNSLRRHKGDINGSQVMIVGRI